MRSVTKPGFMNLYRTKLAAFLDSDRGRVMSNGSWSALQQVITMGFNAVLGILLVLVLPQEDFGLYSYATAMVAIGMSVMTAGMSGLALQALVQAEDRNAEIMAALLLVREVFALVGYVAIGLLAYLTASDLALAVTLLASVALFGRALDAPEFWYVSRLRTRITARIRISVSIAMFIVRLGLILWFPNIWVFIGAYVLEGVLVGALIYVRYRFRDDSPGVLKPAIGDVRTLVTRSVPLMLSGFASQINLRGDVVIISSLLGAASVGIYAAAARLSELAYFLPVVFMNVAFPGILRLRKQEGADSPAYIAAMQRAYDTAFWSGVLVAGGIALTGSILITTVFGPEYAASRSVLLIHVAACPFIFMAAVYSKWIIAENILWTSLLRHALGAGVNIALCLYLIPAHGVQGAAMATGISYIVASYLSCFVGGPKNRQAGWAMTRAMAAPIRYAPALGQRLREKQA